LHVTWNIVQPTEDEMEGVKSGLRLVSEMLARHYLRKHSRRQPRDGGEESS